MTARKGRNNVVRLDAQAADGTNGFDAFNSFSVDVAPGYTVHVGARNASLNLREYISYTMDTTTKYSLSYIIINNNNNNNNNNNTTNNSNNNNILIIIVLKQMKLSSNNECNNK